MAIGSDSMSRQRQKTTRTRSNLTFSSRARALDQKLELDRASQNMPSSLVEPNNLLQKMPNLISFKCNVGQKSSVDL